ncbi:MAG: zinc ribbon domain-containing protein [Bacteroides sp.]|nr:zinc ribbon domain-containing protein [Bacteroides sp.]MCM1549298.1 zinc ribbon domain-containing protein [Clostridium sp.]
MEEIRCSVCGTVVNPGDTFCQNCGSPVAAAADAKTEAAPEQQDTTVLSGNPFSGSADESQTTNAASGSYQASGTYQQPSSGMDAAGAQGTYGTYNTTYNVNNYNQPATQPQSKGLGIAGLILSIIGLLTSCCYGGLLFGLIGLILSIVYLVKKGSKGLGISGTIIGAISLLTSLVLLIMLIATGSSVMDEMQEINDQYSSGSGNDYNYDYDYDTDYDDDYNYGSSNVSGTNQIMINGSDLYTLPASLSSLGFTVNAEQSGDKITEIQENGLYSGDYEFVVLDSDKGYSVWGFIENTGSDTVYSLDELEVTGINVDNYSSACTAYSAEVYGGVTLNMSRSDVEALIGTEDMIDGNDMAVYESASGNEVLRLEYDDYDYVCGIDITIYK